MIRFNSNLSLLVWGIVWCILAWVVLIFDASGWSFILIFSWTTAGNSITDKVAEKDWDGLKTVLIIWLITAVVSFIIYIFWLK